MCNVLKSSPVVFAVGNTYQIMVPVSCETLMWVKVGDKSYYDESNGIIRSRVDVHRMTVPMDELDRERNYTVCYRKVIERKPYFTESEEVVELKFEFSPIDMDRILAYQIADAHNMVDEPIAAAKFFEKEYGKINLLILNGDIPNHSGKTENFNAIYEIASQITGGKIPVVFSRGNHDTRGVFAENIAEYTPCENGNSYYSFKLGCLWGTVLDCGEDKVDSHEQYGNTACFHEMRLRETEYIKSLIEKGNYLHKGIKHKIVVSHMPFTRQYEEVRFNIEGEIYSEWAKLLKENIKPEIMICGHVHKLDIYLPGGENDFYGQPCPVVVGSMPKVDEQYFAGSGFIFDDCGIKVIFNDKDKILSTYQL